jgi:hypothetical protein
MATAGRQSTRTGPDGLSAGWLTGWPNWLTVCREGASLPSLTKRGAESMRAGKLCVFVCIVVCVERGEGEGERRRVREERERDRQSQREQLRPRMRRSPKIRLRYTDGKTDKNKYR